MSRPFVAALNGARSRADHPAVPVSAAQLAADAAQVAAVGATEVHVHPRRENGMESLDPDDVAATVQSIQASVPGLRVSVTTGAWIEPNPRRRVRLIDSWTVLPTSATVNVHEDGAADVARALCRRGVGVEAGLFTLMAAEQFVTGPLLQLAFRVLIEPVDRPEILALYDIESITHTLDRYGVQVPRLVHGEGVNAWPVLQRAQELGVPTRIGLEDTLWMPDGSHPQNNAAMVRNALAY